MRYARGKYDMVLKEKELPRIPNPSFEDGSTALWQVRTGNFTVTSEDKHSGSYCGKMADETTSIIPLRTFEVIPHHLMEVSWWHKASSDTINWYLYAFFYDLHLNYVTVWQTSGFPTVANKWEQMVFYVPVHDTAKYMLLEFKYYLSSGQYVYVDDFYVLDVSNFDVYPAVWADWRSLSDDLAVGQTVYSSRIPCAGFRHGEYTIQASLNETSGTASLTMRCAVERFVPLYNWWEELLVFPSITATGAIEELFDTFPVTEGIGFANRLKVTISGTGTLGASWASLGVIYKR